MPIYPERVAEELEASIEEFEDAMVDDPELAAEYRDALEDCHSGQTVDEIEAALREEQNPGAVPTEEFDETGSPVIPFDPSRDWTAHESVNRWAREQLEGVPTVAADGSQIDPISEFNIPVALVQAVWLTNHHVPEGEYTEDAELDVLTPEDLVEQDTRSGHMRVNTRAVPDRRFELELEVLEEQVRSLADLEPPPVVLFDGSVVLSFTRQFDPSTQDRYLSAMGRLLAASKRHEVPVVAYIAGSKATDVQSMLRRLDSSDVGDQRRRAVRDYSIFDPMMSHWGDRTILYRCHRDDTIAGLETTYDGMQYRFDDRILFTYLNSSQGSGLDRIEFPRWIVEAGLKDHVLDVVRAESAVGRGYPEIVQQVDADAVVDSASRDRFLRLFQKFAEEHEIGLEWDSKMLSKQRRRR